jgi:carboxylate-amine ligase
MQYVARPELIFGMHVHVAVDGPEKAIQVVNGLLVHLPQLLALTASSPFWRGEPTGLASSRQMVFAAFPRSGPRPASATTPTTPRSSASSSAPAASRLHPHLVGHPPAPAARHGGDPDLRRGHARRGRRRRRRLLPGARASSTPSSSTGTRRSRPYHRILTAENKWLAARYGLEAP